MGEMSRHSPTAAETRGKGRILQKYPVSLLTNRPISVIIIRYSESIKDPEGEEYGACRSKERIRLV